jgi:hypothetical protein
MESGYRSPLIDFFRRGEVARDIRQMAAEGALAPRAHEQLALLIHLSDDADASIAASANATLDALPVEPLQAFLARSDVPDQMRGFFTTRGVSAGDQPAADTGPLVDADTDPEPAADEADEKDEPLVLSTLSIMQRMKLAMKGTKGQRAQLIRDSNKLVAAAVLSSPKLTESEVEAFAKMANVSEETLRTIAMNRSWAKNYGVIAGLTRNPKTPVAIAMQMVHRLNDRDLKSLMTDRNVQEVVRLTARRLAVKGPRGSD